MTQRWHRYCNNH